MVERWSSKSYMWVRFLLLLLKSPKSSRFFDEIKIDKTIFKNFISSSSFNQKNVDDFKILFTKRKTKKFDFFLSNQLSKFKIIKLIEISRNGSFFSANIFFKSFQKLHFFYFYNFKCLCSNSSFDVIFS